MNIFKNLEDSLYTLASTLFPTWRIIFPYQNGPEPETPYLVINVTHLDAIGREHNSDGVTVDEFDVGTATSVQTYNAKIRFELVGSNDTNATAGEMIHQLDLALRSPLAYELQHANNLSLFKKSAVMRLPLKRETDMFMFFQLDTQFGYTVKSVFDQDWIEATTLYAIYNDAGREPDHVITSTIEITTGSI